MRCKVLVVLAAAFLCTLSPALAYQFEITPFLNYTFISDFDDIDSNALDRADFEDSSGYGLTAGMDLSPFASIERIWDHVSPDLTVHPKVGPAPNAVGTDIDQIHFGGLYLFNHPHSKLRPFVSFSGGLNWYPTERIGLRWTPTYVNSSDVGIACDPFFCYTVGDSNYLYQTEFGAGLIFRFGR